jgi:hypothetical protein
MKVMFGCLKSFVLPNDGADRRKPCVKQNTKIKNLLSLKQEMAELKALIKNTNQPVK